MEKINLKKAYCLIIDYLTHRNAPGSSGYSDDVQFLIEDMMFLSDGKPCDPAAWSDWIKSVCKTKMIYDNQYHDTFLTFDEIHAALVDFLKEYAYRTNSDETKKFIDENISLKKDTPLYNVNQAEWIKSINKIVAQDPSEIPFLTLIKKRNF